MKDITLKDFDRYNENFWGKPCILALFSKDEEAIEELFKNNSKKAKLIISKIKSQKNLLWIGRTNNSKFRIEDFYSSNKRENSLQESIAQLIAGKSITNKKEEYDDIRKIIATWLNQNAKFHAYLFSDLESDKLEVEKKKLIQKYKPPFNRKYNKKNFNEILFAK